MIGVRSVRDNDQDHNLKTIWWNWECHRSKSSIRATHTSILCKPFLPRPSILSIVLKMWIWSQAIAWWTVKCEVISLLWVKDKNSLHLSWGFAQSNCDLPMQERTAVISEVTQVTICDVRLKSALTIFTMVKVAVKPMQINIYHNIYCPDKCFIYSCFAERSKMIFFPVNANHCDILIQYNSHNMVTVNQQSLACYYIWRIWRIAYFR